MAASIIDGESIANKINKLTENILQSSSIRNSLPTLSVVAASKDGTIKNLFKNCRINGGKIGVEVELVLLPDSIDLSEFIGVITALNLDPNISGILIAKPLPEHLADKSVDQYISIDKEIEGLHPKTYADALLGTVESPRVPPVVGAILKVIDNIEGCQNDLDVVVINSSHNLGKPLLMQLVDRGMTVTMCHDKTRGLKAHLMEADIIISAIGKPNKINSQWMKKGVVAVDVGVHIDSQQNISGDFEFDSASKIASWITPVPEGVGPICISILLQETARNWINIGLNQFDSNTKL